MEIVAARVPVAELLNAGIRALADSDAAQLERLTGATRGTRWPATAQEQEIAQEKLQTLGALIALTGRNLRLLHGARGRVAAD